MMSSRREGVLRMCVSLRIVQPMYNVRMGMILLYYNVDESDESEDGNETYIVG